MSLFEEIEVAKAFKKYEEALVTLKKKL